MNSTISFCAIRTCSSTPQNVYGTPRSFLLINFSGRSRSALQKSMCVRSFSRYSVSSLRRLWSVFIGASRDQPDRRTLIHLPAHVRKLRKAKHRERRDTEDTENPERN